MLAIGLALGWYIDRYSIIYVFDEVIRTQYNFKWIGGGVPYHQLQSERSSWVEEEVEFDERRSKILKKLTFKVEQESDGRWIAEAPPIPGVMAYGKSRAEAIDRVNELVGLVIESKKIDEDLFKTTP